MDDCGRRTHYSVAAVVDQCGQTRAADCGLSAVLMTNPLHQTWDAEFQESKPSIITSIQQGAMDSVTFHVYSCSVTSGTIKNRFLPHPSPPLHAMERFSTPWIQHEY